MVLEKILHQFKVHEYHKFISSGILKENDKLELIEGKMLDMSPIGSKHAGVVKKLSTFLNHKLYDKAIIGVQDPVTLGEYSEPEPDISVLKYREDFYSGGNPMPDDIFLLIEVADSSLEYDRDVKIPLYAKAGIKEVWLINLIDKNITQYQNPSGNEFKQRAILKNGDTVQSTILKEISISVDEII